MNHSADRDTSLHRSAYERIEVRRVLADFAVMRPGLLKTGEHVLIPGHVSGRVRKDQGTPGDEERQHFLASLIDNQGVRFSGRLENVIARMSCPVMLRVVPGPSYRKAMYGRGVIVSGQAAAGLNRKQIRPAALSDIEEERLKKNTVRNRHPILPILHVRVGDHFCHEVDRMELIERGRRDCFRHCVTTGNLVSGISIGIRLIGFG